MAKRTVGDVPVWCGSLGHRRRTVNPRDRFYIEGRDAGCITTFARAIRAKYEAVG